MLTLVVAVSSFALHPSCKDVSLITAYNAAVAEIKSEGLWAQIFSIDPSQFLSFDCSSDPNLIPYPPRSWPHWTAPGKVLGCLRYKSTNPAYSNQQCNTNCMDDSASNGMGMNDNMGMGMGLQGCPPNVCQCLGLTQLDAVLNSGAIRVGDPWPKALYGTSDYMMNNFTFAIVAHINAHYGTGITVVEDYGITCTDSPSCFEALIAGLVDMLSPNFSFAGVLRGLQRGYASLVQPTCASSLAAGTILVPIGTTLADVSNPNGNIKMCTSGAGTQAVYQAAIGRPVELLDPTIITNDEAFNQLVITQYNGCNAWPDVSLANLLNPDYQDGTDNPASLATIASTFEGLPAPFYAPQGSFMKC